MQMTVTFTDPLVSFDNCLLDSNVQIATGSISVKLHLNITGKPMRAHVTSPVQSVAKLLSLKGIYLFIFIEHIFSWKGYEIIFNTVLLFNLQ